MALEQTLYERFRQPVYEFRKFAAVGITGVAFNYYLLGLGHDQPAVFVALNVGIAAATAFRFWSYRQFVWATPTSPAHREGPVCAGS